MKSQQNRIELEIRPEWPQDHDFATTVTSIEQKLHKPTVSGFDEEKEEEEGLGEFSVLADKLPPNSSYCIQVIFPKSHRAMFKLGGKNLFVLCLLVKNLSAVYSADRCDF